MRALFTCVVLFGCSIPDKHLIGGDARAIDTPPSIDAPSSGDGPKDGSSGDGGAPFACLGQPLPTTAPSQIVLSGHTVTAPNGNALANVAVSGFLVTNPNPIITVTSDANGQATATVPTSGQPINGFLVANAPTGSGYMRSVVYPSRPFDQDTSITLFLVTPSNMNLAGQVANVTIDTTKAQMSVAVVDCNNATLANATVTILDPSNMVAVGAVRYTVNGIPSSSATSTDASGVAFVFNVPPGTVVVTASVGTMNLRSHNLNAPGGDWTQTAIQP